MGISKFPIGFWNYMDIADFDDKALTDWDDSAFSMLMSPSYSLDDNGRSKIHGFLDWCGNKGIKVMLQDPRISMYPHLKQNRKEGERFRLPDTYERDALSAVDEFGAHPAVFGFFVIDEPAWDVLDAVIEAVNIVRKHSGKLPFVNFLPYSSKMFERIRYKDYSRYIQNYVEKTGSDVICYDFYAQMTERQYEDPGYFTNLQYFSSNSRRLGISFWNTVLTTPHFRYRMPSYDDMRWQVNTSLAYGAKGILYFTFYTPNNTYRNETNYRQGPINWWGERTPTFYHIRDVNRELHERWGDLFMELSLARVCHYPKAPADGLELMDGSGVVKDMGIINGVDPHIIISEFIHQSSNKEYIFVVNANPRDSVYVSLGLPNVTGIERFTMQGRQYPVPNEIGTFDYFETRMWLAPGQGELLAITKQ